MQKIAKWDPLVTAIGKLWRWNIGFLKDLPGVYFELQCKDIVIGYFRNLFRGLEK